MKVGAPRADSGPRWLRRVLGPGHKLGALVVVAAIAAAGALVGVAWAAGFSTVEEVLLHPRWRWLGAAVIAEVVAYLGYTIAYRELVRAEGGAELDPPKAAALVATGFGVFLQGGGFALDREALKRSGLSADEARQRVLGLGALEYAVLGPAAAIAALILLLHASNISMSLTLPWLIGVPAGAAITLAALRFRSWFDRGGGWRARVARALASVNLLLCMLRQPAHSWRAFGGIAAYWLGDIGCLWAALHMFAAQPPPTAQLILGYASGYAVTRRALPLGGAGIVEALLPFALGWVSIGLPQALLAVIVYRMINLWLPMIPAIASIPALARMDMRTNGHL